MRLAEEPGRNGEPDPGAVRPTASPLAHRASACALALVVLAVGCVYLLGVRCIGGQACWREHVPGYYNYLGRAFAGGHLYLPVTPSAELLALPDPWDPAKNGAHRLHDLVLFDGRYYLYHGSGPALLLFAPWRLLTGDDLPENVALWAMCFGGYLFACGALMRVLALARVTPHCVEVGLMALVLGLSQGVPYLLNRIWVYEIAIAGGYLCTSAGVFFLLGGLHPTCRGRLWFALSGLSFGLAIACRPHLAVAGALAIAALSLRAIWPRSPSVSRPTWGELIWLAGPFLLAGAAVAAYNHARFGNPLEFGVTYLLAGTRRQQRIGLSSGNVASGLYYFLVCPPRFDAVFPWVHLALRFPFGSRSHALPAGSFLEPIAGALWLAPFIAAPLVLPLSRRITGSDPGRVRARAAVWGVALTGVSVLLFLAAAGLTTQRYEVDFLPWLVLAAVANCAIWLGSAKGMGPTAARTLLAGLAVYSLLPSLALGISGPYDEFLRTRPAKYVRIAGWLSPVASYRPRLDPAVAIEADVRFTRQAEGFVEPLLAVGRDARGFRLDVKHASGRIRLVAVAESTTTWDLAPPNDRPVRIRAQYAPDARELRVIVDGVVVMRQTLTALVTAPAQVSVGRTWAAPRFSADRFTGDIRVIRSDIGPAAHEPSA